MDWQKSLELYEKLILLIPSIERKGKSMPYTSKNGHMFSFIDKNGEMGLRLSEDDRDKFIEKYNTRLMEQHGRVMKEYVIVPSDLLEKTKKLESYFLLSLEYVSNLKPKATKKKKQ